MQQYTVNRLPQGCSGKIRPPLNGHPQEVFLAQFSLYVYKGGLKPQLFHLPPPPLYGQQLFFVLFPGGGVVVLLYTAHFFIPEGVVGFDLTLTTLKYFCVNSGDQRIFLL